METLRVECGKLKQQGSSSAEAANNFDDQTGGLKNAG